MRDDARRGLIAYVTPLAAYLFFFLQFLVMSDFSYHLVRRVNVFQIDLTNDANRYLFVSTCFFVPYIVTVWFFRNFLRSLYSRFSLLGRLSPFDETVQKIIRYHHKHRKQIAGSSHASSLTSVHGNTALMYKVMIDLLLTDFRDAMESLCACANMRVSVYAKQLSYLADGSYEPVLKMICSTEFEKDYEKSAVFRQLNTTKRFQGYCGLAWDTGEPQGGTFSLFFHRDRNFFSDKIAHRTKSFLCLPVKDGSLPGEPVSLIVSIDSPNRFDLLLTKSLRLYINQISEEVGNICLEYVKSMPQTTAD